MLSIIKYIFEFKKEALVGFSLAILYITYYMVEVVKKPILICREGEFRRFLEQKVPLLSEYYWPTPWCIEARLQTVLGALVRSRLDAPIVWRREVVRLEDGGQLALDWAACDVREPRAVLVVLPGLTGTVDADYVRCIVCAARDLRVRCVVVNYRGGGGLSLSTPRLYSAVSHDDVSEAVRAVHAASCGLPLLCVGVSLGGLVLCQYLSAAGAGSLVRGALTVSAPLDVERGAASVARVHNLLLSAHMAHKLRCAVRSHDALRGEWSRVRSARTLREFDSVFTAQHFGFGSVEEYYRAATVRDKLHKVSVPLLCVSASDDPIQPLCALPAREAEAAGVALAVTPRGGHVAYTQGWWPFVTQARTQYITRIVTQYFGALLDEPQLLTKS